MRGIDKVLEEISSILELYHKEGARIDDIKRLTACRIKLTGNLFPLANQVAQMQGLKDEAYTMRKLAFAKTFVRLKDKNRKEQTKYTDTEIKAKTEIEIEELIADEATAAKGHIQVKLIYDAVKEALSTLNQQISNLKDEKRSSVKQV